MVEQNGKYASWAEVSPEAYEAVPLSPYEAESVRRALAEQIACPTSYSKGVNEFCTPLLFKDLCLAVCDAFTVVSVPDDRPALADVRDEIAAIAKAAVDLAALLDGASDAAKAAIGWDYDTGTGRSGRWQRGPSRLASSLHDLASDGALALKDLRALVRKGEVQPLTILIVALERTLKGHGVLADASAGGPLHLLCRLVLAVPDYAKVFPVPDRLGDAIRAALCLSAATKTRGGSGPMPLKIGQLVRR